MKLKEKLALESVQNCGEFSNPCYKWYLKGFEAAREMAVKELEGSTGDAAGLDEIIKSIGEGEVSGGVKE